MNKTSKPYNWERTARFGLFNLILFMPSLHFYTAKLLPRLFVVRSLASLLKKLAFDQTIGCSAFVVLFYVGMSAFEGKGLEAGIKNVKEKYWRTMKTGWMIWPAANLLNYGLIPIHFQVLFTNIVAFGWNAYLSFMQNSYHK